MWLLWINGLDEFSHKKKGESWTDIFTLNWEYWN